MFQLTLCHLDFEEENFSGEGQYGFTNRQFKNTADLGPVTGPIRNYLIYNIILQFKCNCAGTTDVSFGMFSNVSSLVLSDGDTDSETSFITAFCIRWAEIMQFEGTWVYH